MSEPEKKPLTWLSHIFNLVLLLLISGIGISAWKKLPPQIPVHFSADGLPNRWTSKGGELLLLFLIPWLITGLMYGCSLIIPWLRKHPQWMNIPNKEKFLALPPARQELFFTCLKGFFFSTAAAVNLILLGAVYSTVQVGLGVYDRLPWWGVWPGLAIIMAVVIFNTLKMLSTVNHLTSQ